MSQARAGHTATDLFGGRVLILGGWSVGASIASAEVYDAVSGTWSPFGPHD